MVIERTVLEAKRFGVFSCQPTMSLADAARLMVEEDISALVVVDDAGCLDGIITRTDLLRACLDSKDWKTEPVSNYMNRDVVSVTTQTRLIQVAEMLVEKHIHRVVVVRDDSGKNRPVSVVSAADLVYHMVKEL